MKTGLPSKLKIGPLRYTVKTRVNLHRKAEDMAYMESFEHEGAVVNLRGIHMPDQLVIELKAGMPDGHMKLTLLHEVLHALLDQAYLDRMFDNAETEEKFVARMAPWLLAAVQENPRLVEFLTDRRQGGAGSATWWRRHG